MNIKKVLNKIWKPKKKCLGAENREKKSSLGPNHYNKLQCAHNVKTPQEIKMKKESSFNLLLKMKQQKKFERSSDWFSFTDNS